MKMRKKFLIYPRFQLLLLLCNFVVVSLGYLAVVIAIRHFFGQLHLRGELSGLKPDHYYYIFLAGESHRLFKIIAGAYVCSVILTNLMALFLSQKIAGPITRMIAYFSSLPKGSPAEVLEFRKGDFFPELPRIINEALSRRP